MSEHPSSKNLERFLLGELPAEIHRQIVRHLLAGCASCRAAIQEKPRASEAAYDRAITRALGSEPVREELAVQQRRRAEPVVRRIAAAVQGPQLVNSRDLRLRPRSPAASATSSMQAR